MGIAFFSNMFARIRRAVYLNAFVHADDLLTCPSLEAPELGLDKKLGCQLLNY
jgi:hypothetical protein